MGRGVIVKALNSLVSRALFGLGAVISFLWPLALGAHSATATTAARVPEITNKSTGNGSTTIHIGLPPGVETDGIQIVLNGKNVAERFEGSACGKGTCEDATLSAIDGLREEKNVLAVIAKGGVSGRLRFDNRTAGTPALASIVATSLLSSPDKAQATVSDVPPPVLEPTVTVRTAYTGGWNGAIDAAHPWLTVGNQYFPNVQPANCGPAGPPTGRYLVIVLDRQTLQKKTSAPESSAFVFAPGGTATGLMVFNDLANNNGNSFSGASYRVDTSGRVSIWSIIPSSMQNISLAFELYLDGNGNGLVAGADNIQQTGGLAYLQTGLSDYEGNYAINVRGFLNGPNYEQPYGAVGPVTVTTDIVSGTTEYTSQDSNLRPSPSLTPFDNYANVT